MQREFLKKVMENVKLSKKLLGSSTKKVLNSVDIIWFKNKIGEIFLPHILRLKSKLREYKKINYTTNYITKFIIAYEAYDQTLNVLAIQKVIYRCSFIV